MSFIDSMLSLAKTKDTKTLNGAVSHSTSGSALLDLFSKGVSTTIAEKEKMIVQALQEDPILAVKVVCYLRDCRGGQGNKDTARVLHDIVIKNLTSYDAFMKGYYNLLPYLPTIGSWKDVYNLYGKLDVLDALILSLVETALKAKDGLAAKWFPRQSQFHKDYAKYTARDIGVIRREVASLTKVVETQMCNGEWHNINYSHVPSVAFKKYTKAFKKNDSSRFEQFLNKVIEGDPTVKVNASVMYPHDIAQAVVNDYYGQSNSTQIKAANAQWKNLPNFVNPPMNILPVIDVSGSMSSTVPGTNVSALSIAVGLGLYFSERNTGDYKDIWVNFSTVPSVQRLQGDTLSARWASMNKNNWAGSTDIQKVHDLIINASRNNPETAPKVILIVSDMEFNDCGARYTNHELAVKKYKDAGIEMPLTIFWRANVKSGQQPVKMHDEGTVMINGYSPAIMEVICKINKESIKNLTPFGLMLDAVAKYSFVDECFGL